MPGAPAEVSLIRSPSEKWEVKLVEDPVIVFPPRGRVTVPEVADKPLFVAPTSL